MKKFRNSIKRLLMLYVMAGTLLSIATISNVPESVCGARFIQEESGFNQTKD